MPFPLGSADAYLQQVINVWRFLRLSLLPPPAFIDPDWHVPCSWPERTTKSPISCTSSKMGLTWHQDDTWRMGYDGSVTSPRTRAHSPVMAPYPPSRNGWPWTVLFCDSIPIPTRFVFTLYNLECVIENIPYTWFSVVKKQGPIESRTEEMMRVRYFIIFLYLEDETIMITEPPDDRAEMSQGKIFRWFLLMSSFFWIIIVDLYFDNSIEKIKLN